LGLDHLGAMSKWREFPATPVLDEARKEIIDICQDLLDLKAKTNLLNERVQFLGSLIEDL
jgi:hypothetical protein